MFTLVKTTKIFIVAPANFATGGPELLHQLAYNLKSNGYIVFMYYTPNNIEKPVHENYKEYNIDFVRNLDDNKENILIVPETRVNMLLDYKNIQKIVWWLSVDNYFLYRPKPFGIINRMILNKFNSQKYIGFDSFLKSIDYHLVQSEYAEKTLQKQGIKNISYLSDFLHHSFLSNKVNINKKENIVAFNPKKGIKFTNLLIKNASHINFVPIENMTRMEVVELLKKAKVYIDFGFHPGKDRIPREATVLKACIITNKKGSAKYFKDVPILDEYKFDETNRNIELIIRKIDDCFTNYKRNIDKFDNYYNEIYKQEEVFYSEVEKLFTK